MSKKNLFSSILLFSALLLNSIISSVEILAADLESSSATISLERLNAFSKITQSESISFFGNNYQLYPTFESNDQAVKNFHNLYSENFATLSEICNLGTVSVENIGNYHMCILDQFSNIDQILNTIFLNDFNLFMDIFENSALNSEIKAIQSINSTDDYITLFVLLPQQQSDQLKVNTRLQFQISNSLLVTRNISAGSNYAMQYAVTPNTINHYYTFSSDCTNFTSQILEAMGQPQDITGGYNETMGWWHYYSIQAYQYVHYHSISFIRADTFMKYFGVAYTSTSHFNFSYNLLAGDFIGLDYASDGDWNHVGYVVTRDTYAGNYIDENGTYHLYYNYFVAQHSSNYKLWVSSFSNDWDIQSTGTKYGRMER